MSDSQSEPTAHQKRFETIWVNNSAINAVSFLSTFTVLALLKAAHRHRLGATRRRKLETWIVHLKGSGPFGHTDERCSKSTEERDNTDEPFGLHFTSSALLSMRNITNAGFHVLVPSGSCCSLHTKAFRSCEQVTMEFEEACQSTPLINMSCWISRKEPTVLRCSDAPTFHSLRRW